MDNNYSPLSGLMDGIIGNLDALLPEFTLAGLIVLAVLGETLGGNRRRHLIRLLAFSGILIFLWEVWQQWQSLGPQSEWEGGFRLFGGMIFLDRFSVFFKVLAGFGAFMAWVMAFFYHKSSPMRPAGESVALISSVTLGASLLAMSSNWLMVYLSLEVISISSYLLTASGQNKHASEAAIKYAIFGGTASAIMLFGLSLLYGFTGTLDFYHPDYVVSLLEVPAPALMLAMLMVLSGVLFKLAAVPFHLWAPDVYQAAPTPVVAFFSVVPKLAGFALIWKFAFVAHLYGQGEFPWQEVLAVVALASMFFGNLAALRQEHPRRMLAYSSIAQAGFLLTGVVAFSEFGLSASLFYATVYAVMSLAAFFLVQIAEVNWGFSTLNQYKGVGRIHAFYGVMFLTVMISLAGIPPVAGFTGKLLVFSALWDTWSQGDSTLILLLFVGGLLNTVISIFYYLRIPYLMFFKDLGASVPQKNLRQPENYFVLALVIVLLWWFFQPGWLMEFINSINFAL
jgi:NADH-quinone oxidoreductase subunit N